MPDKQEYTVDVTMKVSIRADSPSTAIRMVLSALESNVPGKIVRKRVSATASKR